MNRYARRIRRSKIDSFARKWLRFCLSGHSECETDTKYSEKEGKTQISCRSPFFVKIQRQPMKMHHAQNSCLKHAKTPQKPLHPEKNASSPGDEAGRGGLQHSVKRASFVVCGK
ncbi:hypothetical protein L596_015550 [Steinernema carpocapsae]|uniref:Uncharacterized protein n=1 Tax=Steinernema carpocapsae TaxID=34508 RepID=A0A4U5NFY6_STECR|nr:hypothetical protein L596_015550 [Steinernema carpocapsae]